MNSNTPTRLEKNGINATSIFQYIATMMFLFIVLVATIKLIQPNSPEYDPEKYSGVCDEVCVVTQQVADNTKLVSKN